MTDYRVYPLDRRQRVAAVLAGCLCCYAIVWLMYRQPVIALIGAPCGFFYPRMLQERLRRKRQARLRLHFKDALHALSSLLTAGRSVENAFGALEDDLSLLIGDPNADLLREIRVIVNRLRNGEPLERPLSDLAERSGLEEMNHFAEVFRICKRAGGDLVEVVRRTSGLIGEKMEVEQEVAVLIAQKRFESRLMMGMPFGFVGLLGFFAGEYMAPLRQGGGILVLTVCLFLLAGCCLWMLKIMDIRL
ncbi:type II secretion system F family protein [Cohnella nanjingensis]|uniref:Type II secretion system F family protein n=1 Tax=Cohnella nanjingensis TaxID=1387779 RepID=A0A7X0RZ78_9BACL|nr:type II secretion system F family protein [Cohnella nanjingensis]MBB6674779.1 type II secretion system F family protein [Cohnella nanjingensis]